MLWIKAAHLISVIAWFAGLLYLPRLFVYHADCEDDAGRRRFSLMESRLYWRIMTPAMAFTLLFGLMLLGYGFRGGWLLAKLALVALLVVFHASCGLYIRRLRSGHHPNAKFFRFYNEIPTLLLLLIVCLVTIKPF